MSSLMAGIPLVNAVLFGVYGNTRKLFADQDALSTHFYSGMIAGGAQSFITSPMELIKTRLQLQDEGFKRIRALQTYRTIKPQYSGPIDCTRKIFLNEGGIRGLSKGLGTTFLRDAPALGVYFASYEYFYRIAAKNSGGVELSTASILMAGGMAGVTSWMLCYPIDAVKSRIQEASESSSFTTTTSRMYRQEGLRSFFRGVNAAVIRAYPANAAIFFTANFVHSLYAKSNSTTATLIVVESVQQQMHYHLHYQYLAERMHFHTIPNHL
ncbi:mitochondrial basic amino acids transporter-like isoform X2 [Varroa destructor]|nr:mitochondrial basic amino acids transporter-like isoform X2 [Varroa destructor]